MNHWFCSRQTLSVKHVLNNRCIRIYSVTQTAVFKMCNKTGMYLIHIRRVKPITVRKTVTEINNSVQVKYDFYSLKSQKSKQNVLSHSVTTYQCLYMDCMFQFYNIFLF